LLLQLRPRSGLFGPVCGKCQPILLGSTFLKLDPALPTVSLVPVPPIGDELTIFVIGKAAVASLPRLAKLRPGLARHSWHWLTLLSPTAAAAASED
jgi:hypothetical protein